MRLHQESSLEDVQDELQRMNLPDYMASAVHLYLTKGLPPGSFLTAVLENNLVDAVSQADHANFFHIAQWVSFLMFSVPPISWGSPEKVSAWMQAMREASDATQSS